MKFVLLVEGQTEKDLAAAFLKRWIDLQLKQPVGIQVVSFNGYAELARKMAAKTKMHLDGLNEPPVKFLDRIYQQTTKKNYKKTTYGKQLFPKLDPLAAVPKCPYLKEMLDEMLRLATAAGL